ncbi:hypothetical protein Tco_1010945, partial [Tanacetum coccineum]
SVVASKPKTMQEATEMAIEVMVKRIHTFVDRQTENKRKPDNNQQPQHHHQNKRQNTGMAYAAGTDWPVFKIWATESGLFVSIISPDNGLVDVFCGYEMDLEFLFKEEGGRQWFMEELKPFEWPKGKVFTLALNGASLERCAERVVAYFREHVKSQLKAVESVIIVACGNSFRQDKRWEKKSCSRSSVPSLEGDERVFERNGRDDESKRTRNTWLIWTVSSYETRLTRAMSKWFEIMTSLSIILSLADSRIGSLQIHVSF